MVSKKVIGITDCGKFQNYFDWIATYSSELEIVKLSYRLNNLSDIEKCTHIVLTGGEDVHPRFYNQPEMLQYCSATDMDEARDEFEWKVLEYSQKNNLFYLIFYFSMLIITASIIQLEINQSSRTTGLVFP